MASGAFSTTPTQPFADAVRGLLRDAAVASLSLPDWGDTYVIAVIYDICYVIAMKYEALLETLGDWPVIDSASLRLLGENHKALSVQLSRWVNAGKLIQLRRGIYILPERLRRSKVSKEYLANLLVSPSYVSLERALSLHGHIPETVPLIQSVTTGRPTILRTPLGEFQYRHVKRSWFFGYREMSIGESCVFIAGPEKALLDLIYLARGEFTEERIAELRLQDLDGLDLEEFEHMAERDPKPRLLRAVRQVRDYVARERETTVTL